MAWTFPDRRYYSNMAVIVIRTLALSPNLPWCAESELAPLDLSLQQLFLLLLLVCDWYFLHPFPGASSRHLGQHELSLVCLPESECPAQRWLPSECGGGFFICCRVTMPSSSAPQLTRKQLRPVGNMYCSTSSVKFMWGGTEGLA